MLRGQRNATAAARLWQHQRRYIRTRGGRSTVAPTAAEAAPTTDVPAQTADRAPMAFVSSSRLGLLSGANPRVTAEDDDVDPMPAAPLENPRATVAEIVKRELAAMRAMTTAPPTVVPPSRQQQADGAFSTGNTPDGGALRRPRYSVEELQRLVRRREELKAHFTKRDVADVIRGGSKAADYAARVTALDPAAQFKHRDVVAKVAAARAAGGAAAVAELVSTMSDADVVSAVKSGALDLLDVVRDEDEVDVADEGDLVEAASPLPSEFFTAATHATDITREIMDTALSPASPNDDEAHVLHKYAREGPENFTQSDLKLLQKYEQRTATEYTVATNALLRFVAQRDATLRESLDALDRGKRATLRDQQFQDALDYVQSLEKQEMDKVLEGARPTLRRSPIDRAYFFDGVTSKPPPSAQHSVPPPAEKRGAKRLSRRAAERQLKKEQSAGKDTRRFTQQPV